MLHTTQFPTPERISEPEGRATAEFGAAGVSTTPAPAVEPDFVSIADSPEFQELRGTLRRFVFPMSALFLVWYLIYVLIAAYEPGFMGIRVVGEVNVGLLMGVSQFASTIAITALYLRFASRRIDPLVSELRQAVLGEDVP